MEQSKIIDTMETYHGVQQPLKSLRYPKTVSNSPRNGPESAKMVGVDERYVIAPWGSATLKIAPGPQNGEW